MSNATHHPSANILITGGAGFIGSHTADALVRQGHNVRILDVLDSQIHGPSATFPEYMHPQVECVQGDVRSLDDVRAALEGVDVVYHFAAFTGVGQSMYDLRSYVDTNCTGTATLLEAIVKRRDPLRRFVLSSSRAVYGEGTYECSSCGIVYPELRSRDDMQKGKFAVYCPRCASELLPVPTKEDRPLLPTSVYGWTKRHQEDLCGHVAETHGLPVVCLRYFNVYGSRQSLTNPYTGVIAIFYSRLMSGQPIFLYEGGTPVRDFVHVSDVVRANLLAIEADVEPATRINIGSGMRCTIADVAKAQGEACGMSPDLRDEGQFRVGDILACYSDNSRARQRLGFESQISFEQGLKEFMAWARRHESVDLYEQTVSDLKRHGLFGAAGSKT